MVNIATNFYHMAVQIITYTSQVAVQLLFHGRLYEWCTMFCAENKVYVILNQGLAHSSSFVAPLQGSIRPFQGYADVTVFSDGLHHPSCIWPLQGCYGWAAPILSVSRPFRARWATPIGRILCPFRATLMLRFI